MKAMIFVLLAAGAFVVGGCGAKPAKPEAATNSSGGISPLDAPAQYLGAMGKAQQSAVKTVDLGALRQAIQMFNVETGRNPKDLDELIAEKYLPQIPAAPYGMKIVYDPASGAVNVVKQ